MVLVWGIWHWGRSYFNGSRDLHCNHHYENLLITENEDFFSHWMRLQNLITEVNVISMINSTILIVCVWGGFGSILQFFAFSLCDAIFHLLLVWKLFIRLCSTSHLSLYIQTHDFPAFLLLSPDLFNFHAIFYNLSS